MNLDISALLLIEFCLASTLGGAVSLVVATDLVPAQIGFNAWQVTTALQIIAFDLACSSQI